MKQYKHKSMYQSIHENSITNKKAFTVFNQNTENRPTNNNGRWQQEAKFNKQQVQQNFSASPKNKNKKARSRFIPSSRSVRSLSFENSWTGKSKGGVISKEASGPWDVGAAVAEHGGGGGAKQRSLHFTTTEMGLRMRWVLVVDWITALSLVWKVLWAIAFTMMVANGYIGVRSFICILLLFTLREFLGWGASYTALNLRKIYRFVSYWIDENYFISYF